MAIKIYKITISCELIVLVISLFAAVSTLNTNDIFPKKVDYIINKNSISWLNSVRRYPPHASWQSGFDPETVIATRIQIWKEWAFVLTPRFKSGIPFTLSRMHLGANSNATILLPYPSWKANLESGTYCIKNAIDIFIDDKDVMWVLDNGAAEIERNVTEKIERKILAVDLKKGEVVKTVDITNLTCVNSRLKNIYVENDHSEGTFLYVTDSAITGSIIVWNVSANRGYRTVLPLAIKVGSIGPDILYSTFLPKTINGSSLYLTYLGGRNLFSVQMDNLRRKYENGTLIDKGEKPGKLVVIGSDNGCNVYLRNAGENTVVSWNVNTELVGDNLKGVLAGQCNLICNQITADRTGDLWAFENNFPHFIKGSCQNSGIIGKISKLVEIEYGFCRAEHRYK